MQTTVGQRLKEAIGAIGRPSLRDIASKINTNHTSVADWIHDRHDIPAPKLLEIEAAFGVSAEWLLTGKGAMMVKDRRGVPLLSPSPRNGKGDALSDYVSNATLCFDQGWLRDALRVDPSGIAAFRVDDNCMAPTINQGEVVFVDGLAARPEARDGVWLLRSGDRLVVRRVQLEGAGKCDAMCDNAGYKPKSLDTTALLGYVVGGAPRRY